MSTNTDIKGCFTALITPLDENLAVDYDAFEQFIHWQTEQGVDGIVPCGTTGESPVLSPEEHSALIERAVKAANGKAAVMAGTGSNATDEAIAYSKHAEKSGADALLVVAPYYNKPSQEGIFAHYSAIAKSVGLPIYIYNIPGRSVIDIHDETLARLAEKHSNIAGIKDATGDLARVSTLRSLVGDRLNLLSGEDMTAIAFNAMGGNGVISVTANIAPSLVARVQQLSLSGKYTEALSVHEPLVKLHQILFAEPNPSPVKYALSKRGLCENTVRLPLIPASEGLSKQIDGLLRQLPLSSSHG